MVAEQIASRIETGVWPTGTVVPAEVALAQEFRVSVGTIRRALSELTAGGVLVRRRKTGTVVTGRIPHHSLRFFFDYFRLHARSGKLQNSTSQVLNLTTRPPSPDEATRLALPDDAPVIHLHRLRLVDERPVMHEVVILPAHLVPDFPTDPDLVPHRIYPMLWDDYGLKISAVREQVEADLATETDCRLLNMTQPAAVLMLHEVAYDQMGRPILLNNHRACTREDVYINEIQ
ncbi:GntR family transcriptional regulator [Tianweitania aestuarii]|nr:GntR family transcriptional regulator [Tianweitania aestuarii]